MLNLFSSQNKFCFYILIPHTCLQKFIQFIPLFWQEQLSHDPLAREQVFSKGWISGKD